MPNWCYNRLEIFGPDTAVARLRDAVVSEEQAFDFERVSPTPTAPEAVTPKDGDAPDWYMWRIANWGTKWNARDAGVSERRAPDGRARLCYEFFTAWAPPSPIIERLVHDYPELGFALFFTDEQLCFSGTARWSGGRFVESTSADDEIDQINLGDATREPWAMVALPLHGPLLNEPAPRWELLLDRERLFLPEDPGVLPTTRLRIEADGRAWRQRGEEWIDANLPFPLRDRLAVLRRRRADTDLLPLEVELCEIALDGVADHAPLIGDRRTRILVDLHELGGQRLGAIPYAERRQLRAELATRLAGSTGVVWFDLADPRLAEWQDGDGRAVMSARMVTPLEAALPAARRVRAA